MSLEISLAGKKALLTGGAEGIGKCTALLLAQAGADVFIGDINVDGARATAEEIRERYGVMAYARRCDTASRQDIEDLVEEAWQTMGRIDILNHIAGISRKADYLEMDEELYDRVMAVNAKSTFFIDQAVLKRMIPLRSGKIVNMSSMSGKEGFDTNVAYSASKFAVMGITQAVAKYAAPYQINVNAVCPGIIRTSIWEGLLRDATEAGMDAEAYWEKRIGTIPLKRPQTTEDIARMVVFLSSDFADNMTGQGINITGGLILH